jgi:hypothetical protein
MKKTRDTFDTLGNAAREVLHGLTLRRRRKNEPPLPVDAAERQRPVIRRAPQK